MDRILHDPDVDNSEASLVSLGIAQGSRLTIDFDHPELNPLSFVVQPGDGPIFSTLTARHVLADTPKPLARAASPDQEAAKRTRTNVIEDDDDLIIVS